MPYSFKTSISFGLVYIPVTLSAAAKPRDIGFNLLERGTNKRIKFKRVAEGTDREVSAENTVKGYRYDKDRYVVFEDADLEKLKTKKDRTVNITSFVTLSEIDPVYYEKTYYVTPVGGERAFALLLQAMREMKKVGISKTVLGSKESLVALRASEGGMLLSTLYFHDEIAKPPQTEKIKADKKEKALAETLISAMTAPFSLKEYRNEYNDRLMAAIEDKINGKQTVVPESDFDGDTSADSLLNALLASVDSLGKNSLSEHLN